MLARRAKTVERPEVLRLVVAQNVVIAVVGKDPEITRVRGVPAVVELLDLELAAAKDETERPLVRSVARITFNVNLAHGFYN